MIKDRTEEILEQAQCGFRATRSTNDQIFTLRQQEKMNTKNFEKMYMSVTTTSGRHLIGFGGKAIGKQ